MIFKQRINKWLVNFRKYLFFYRDGYYELPYLSNSPQIMLASFKKMPYTTFDKEHHCIKTNNPFTNGIMYYEELGEGLWIMITEMEFKKNVSTHALYDQEPCDYYFLSYFRYSHKPKDVLVNDIRVPNAGWGLYKPGTQVNAYFAEKDKGIFMDIAFSRDWFDKNIKFNNVAEQNNLDEYLSSGISYKVWKDIVKDSEQTSNTILGYLKEAKTNNASHLSLKILCLDLMNRFFKAMVEQELNSSAVENKINETDRRHLATAERMVLDSLNTSFPGIDTIAKAVHISPTKLKILFKKIYGNSIFQYYQEKQMLLALELLKNKETSVKTVAQYLGYDNASNFVLAFKKFHQFHPAEVA